MSGTTAAMWFLTEELFRQLCSDAVSLAKGESAQEFAGQMAEKAKTHGLKTYLSDKQLTWLCKIADHVKPAEFIGGRR